MNDIIISIFTPQELNHSSYVQTGLFELEKDKFLKNKVILSLKKRLGTIRIIDDKISETNQPHPKTSLYKLFDKNNNREINFATDLYDASFSFSKYALDNCDYIFKRNYEKKYIEKLPLEHQEKILPLGLSFPCVSKNFKAKNKIFISLLFTNLLISTKFDSYLFSRLFRTYKEQIKHLIDFKQTRLINEFIKNDDNQEDYILFQTRCFPHENHEDVKQIHVQRYNLVLLLKDKFGKIFKGGIIPSEIANKNYSDALSNLPSDPVSYLNIVKKAKIVIYTRGLVNSPAWKMAEYLSQGKVIIAEKLTAELPFPLIDNEHLLFFDNDGELTNSIDKLINNQNLCDNLSKNARQYFENYVHPKQNMKRIINFMLEQK